jgi:hypothetical protein
MIGFVAVQKFSTGLGTRDRQQLVRLGTPLDGPRLNAVGTLPDAMPVGADLKRGQFGDGGVAG